MQLRQRFPFFLSVGLVTEGFFLLLAWLLSEPSGVFPGVQVAGRTIGGSFFQEVLLECRKIAQQKEEQPIVLMANGKRLVVKPKELGVHFFPERAAAKAWMAGREFSLWARLRSRWLARRGLSVPMPVRVEKPQLRRVLQNLKKPPRNATVALIRGEVHLIPEQKGWSVDLDGAIEKLVDGLSNGQSFFFLPLRLEVPTITSRELLRVTSLRAQVIVTMTSRHPNAYHNAQLAAQAIDKAVVFPKQVLSLNELIGRRTKERGFLPAPVLINERRDLGLGGGICPVATAVFLAAAQAGMDIVERHPHTRLVRYAQPGLDATLNFPNKDLKIRNPTREPMVLRVQIKSGRILVQVFGVPKEGEIKLITKNQRFGNYLQVTTERLKYGHREFLCRSLYRID